VFVKNRRGACGAHNSAAVDGVDRVALPSRAIDPRIVGLAIAANDRVLAREEMTEIDSHFSAEYSLGRLA
jgi:hypothetical protein